MKIMYIRLFKIASNLFDMRKNTLYFFVAVWMLTVSTSAKSEVNGLESYPLICQKAMILLGQPLGYFTKNFGSIKSDKSHKYPDGEVRKIAYQDSVSLIVEKNKDTGNRITQINLNSIQSIRKAGFNVSTENGLNETYGTPREDEFGVPIDDKSNWLVYGCDSTKITFKTINRKIISLEITESGV
jgi:hypothetical protein